MKVSSSIRKKPKKSEMIQLLHALQSLSVELQSALAMEETALLEIRRNPTDAWAALRNSGCLLKESRSPRKPSIREEESRVAGVLACVRESSHMSFGEYCVMDSGSKRSRIRAGIIYQEERIRSILGQMIHPDPDFSEKGEGPNDQSTCSI